MLMLIAYVRSWIFKRLQRRRAFSVLVALISILVVACQRRAIEPICPEIVSCNKADSLAAWQVDAPTISISNLSDCSVQLLATADKVNYDVDDDIVVTVLLKMHGDCAWKVVTSRYPLLVFHPITIVREGRYDVPLTQDGRDELEDAEKIIRDQPRALGFAHLNPDHNCLSAQLPLSIWYDLSASGAYSTTLIWRNFSGTPAEIVGNPVIFTRD